MSGFKYNKYVIRKSRKHFYGYFYIGMCYENYCIRLCYASRFLSTKWMEFIGFFHRSHWVSMFSNVISFESSAIVRKGKNNTLFSCTSLDLMNRMLSAVLQNMMPEGFDVKALRAFRVLRPLRLVSGVPSK